MCPVYWAKSHQSCSTLCDPIDSSRLPRPWDSPGKNTGVGCRFLLQCMKVKSEREVSRIQLFATPWTAAYQAPPPMGFARQEYWSGVPLPSPRFTMRSFKILSSNWAKHQVKVFSLIQFKSMGSLRVRHDWATSLSLFLSCIGEGNGNPLQCSCLENPRDGGAWWAAVYGVA